MFYSKTGKGNGWQITKVVYRKRDCDSEFFFQL